MSEFDIVIVGGGIAGASLGARIASRARVAILEAEENCATHSTGRSAAFWLAHYGGAPIIPLSMASRPLLEQGWPGGGDSLLRERGARVAICARGEEALARTAREMEAAGAEVLPIQADLSRGSDIAPSIT